MSSLHLGAIGNSSIGALIDSRGEIVWASAAGPSPGSGSRSCVMAQLTYARQQATRRRP